MRGCFAAGLALIALAGCNAGDDGLQSAAGDGSQLSSDCRRVFSGDQQAARLLEFHSTDAASVCACVVARVDALGEDRRVALTSGLADMLRVRDERQIGMEEIFSRFKAGEETLDGKGFTVADLDEMGEMFEDAAENISDDGVCDPP